jgi:hypothetical protein
VAAASTVGDVIARWWSLLGTKGFGLRGGTFTAPGYSHVSFDLRDVRWVKDVVVNRTIEWDRTTGSISASVDVSGGGGANGTLTMSWSDWAPQPYADVSGVLGGRAVSYTFLAP